MTLRDADGFTMIYDFLEQPPRILFPLCLFGMAFSGFFLIRSSLKPGADDKKNIFGITDSSKKSIVGFFGILLGLIMGFWALNLPDYFNTRKIYRQDKLTSASGYVTNLTINNKGKNDNMEFYLNGQRFRFASNDFIDYGCTYDDIHVANIHDSTYLQIHYFVKNGQNIVLRVRTK